MVSITTDTPSNAHDDGIGMTIKQMVTELYNDMKVVRPAVEEFKAQQLDRRVASLEKDRASAVAAGVTAQAFFRFGRWVLATVIALCTLFVSLIVVLHQIATPTP